MGENGGYVTFYPNTTTVARDCINDWCSSNSTYLTSELDSRNTLAGHIAQTDIFCYRSL